MSRESGLVGTAWTGCTAVSVEDDVAMSRIRLLTAAPNPFEGAVRLAYAGESAGPYSISVFDVAGRLIRSYVRAAPTGTVTWDGTNSAGRRVAPGTYFVRLENRGGTQVRRIALIR